MFLRPCAQFTQIWFKLVLNMILALIIVAFVLTLVTFSSAENAGGETKFPQQHPPPLPSSSAHINQLLVTQGGLTLDWDVELNSKPVPGLRICVKLTATTSIPAAPSVKSPRSSSTFSARYTSTAQTCLNASDGSHQLHSRIPFLLLTALSHESASAVSSLATFSPTLPTVHLEVTVLSSSSQRTAFSPSHPSLQLAMKHAENHPGGQQYSPCSVSVPLLSGFIADVGELHCTLVSTSALTPAPPRRTFEAASTGWWQQSASGKVRPPFPHGVLDHASILMDQIQTEYLDPAFDSFEDYFGLPPFAQAQRAALVLILLGQVGVVLVFTVLRRLVTRASRRKRTVEAHLLSPVGPRAPPTLVPQRTEPPFEERLRALSMEDTLPVKVRDLEADFSNSDRRSIGLKFKIIIHRG